MPAAVAAAVVAAVVVVVVVVAAVAVAADMTAEAAEGREDVDDRRLKLVSASSPSTGM